MKKKVLSALLVAAMTATMFAGCGNNNGDNGNKDNAGTQASNAGSAETQSEITDYGSGEIKIWVAENSVDFTKEKVDEFLKSNDAYSGYTAVVEPVGEGDAAGNMITDVEGGADIFGFAQDQLSRLVSAGALQPIIPKYTDWIKENNAEYSVAACTAGETVYAFPMTADNTYFMYYDKSVVTDPASLEGVLKDCEAAGKNFYMSLANGWYLPSFFFATGADISYEVDDAGKFTSCNATLDSDAGVVAMKEMIELSSSKAFQNGDAIDKATNLGAIVTGIWNVGAAKEAFGDNYACAKLPSFKGSDGTDYQLTPFGGYKLLGIKPQTEAGKLAICYELAQYLTNADTQLARYEALGWGPSNVTLTDNEEIKSDEALTAVRDMMSIAVPQGQYPGDYWSLAEAFGTDIKDGKYNKASDDELKKALADFQTTCQSYAGN
ncbi:MAG: extracellular solute-binding protein [Lachnospiraceae bacterium]|nr:extracellular solute-binding protein [Lachnospiraceae bacterium]